MPLIEIPALTDYSPGSLDSFFSGILAQFDRDAAAAGSAEAVEQLRIRWIGRKQGLLTRIGEGLKDAPAEARREVGKRFNALKSAIEPRCDPEQMRAALAARPPRNVDRAPMRMRPSISRFPAPAALSAPSTR